VIAWRRHRFPIDWAEEFEASVGLHLEIGFGDGRFTVRRALENPGERYVGLEISSTSLQRAWRRLRRQQVENVRLLKAGARFALRNLFAPGSLTSITVNFPDPWPKGRHAKHRLLQRNFFELAAARLAPAGHIFLATDHPDYLEFACSEASTAGYHSRVVEPPAAVLETKYALKWRSKGKPLYFQLFTYQGGVPLPQDILERPTVMPHSLLVGSLPDGIFMTKKVEAFADGHVILHEVARSLRSPEAPRRWLVRVTVEEPDLRQQLLVAIQDRGDDIIVRFESFGDPIITGTARGAIHAVTEWLVSLPGMRVSERNY